MLAGSQKVLGKRSDGPVKALEFFVSKAWEPRVWLPAVCLVSGVERMREEREKLKKLLQDTVTMLCKNSLLYERSLRIEGVIGITVDNNDAFLVHINSNIQPAHDSMSEDTEEYYPDVKSEYGFADRPEPAMPGFSGSGFAIGDRMIDTVVGESGDFKAEMKADEDEWGGGYEESYSGLGYPWGDDVTSSNSYQLPVSAPLHHGRPRASVWVFFHLSFCVDLMLLVTNLHHACVIETETVRRSLSLGKLARCRKT